MKRIIVFSFICVFFIACRKTPVEPQPELLINTELKPGLPANPKLINGYMYAANFTVTNAYAYYNVKGAVAFAGFSDPAANILASFDHYNNMREHSLLVSNVSVNELLLNNSVVPSFTFTNRHFYFLYKEDIRFANPVKWTMEGSGPFPASETVLPSHFPLINYKDTFALLNRKRDTVLNAKNIFPACDSLRIILFNGSLPLSKTVSGENPLITFYKEELAAYSGYGNERLKFYAFNYFHKTVNNRVFLFETSTQVTVPVKWSQ